MWDICPSLRQLFVDKGHNIDLKEWPELPDFITLYLQNGFSHIFALSGDEMYVNLIFYIAAYVFAELMI